MATLNLYCGSSDSCFQLTMAHGMPTPHWPLTLSPKITTNTQFIHSPSIYHCITHPALPVFVFVACWWKWCLCVLANLDYPYLWPHMHNISKNKHPDLGLSVWSSDIENPTMTLELNLIRDQHQLFWECVWIWACWLCMSLCTLCGLLKLCMAPLIHLLPYMSN